MEYVHTCAEILHATYTVLRTDAQKRQWNMCGHALKFPTSLPRQRTDAENTYVEYMRRCAETLHYNFISAYRREKSDNGLYAYTDAYMRTTFPRP